MPAASTRARQRKPPTPSNQEQASIYDYVPWLADKMAWLEHHGTTFQDVEATILHALHTVGETSPQDLVRFVLEAHGMPRTDATHVYDIAATMLHRGDLELISERRLRPTRQSPEPRVRALVSVPVSEWANVEKYAYTGRAAWLAGIEDRA